LSEGTPRPAAIVKKKLSFKDQRELDALPGVIEKLETEQRTLHATLADPAFYKQPGNEIAQVKSRLATVEQELTRAYARWEALE
jgi:ATP-binding cassette subfamily F protein uup